jgi:hypothetical protein
MRALLVVLLSLIALPAFADEKSEAEREMVKAEQHLERGEYDAAIARFHVARSLVPSSSGPYLGLGLAHARAGRCDQAIAYLEEYLRRKKTGAKPEAQSTLTECRARLPKPVEPKSVEPKPTEPKPVEPKPTEAKPVEPKPTEPKPVEPKPTEAKPVEKPKPTEKPKPVEKPIVPRPPPPPIQSGQLTVEVGPIDANVLINGVQVAESTRRYQGPMASGDYKVIAEREGWRSATASVKLAPGGRAARTLTLLPLRKHGWLGLAVPFTALALATGIAAITTFYAADGNPEESSAYQDNKTANAAMQGIFYPSLALAATGFVLYGVLNRGRVADGPPLQMSLAPLPSGGVVQLRASF